MSSKKKPESLGIKSFFTSKPAKSAAALDKSEGQKLSAKETECVNLIETEVHGEVHSRPIVKKNAFFMTKVSVIYRRCLGCINLYDS